MHAYMLTCTHTCDFHFIIVSKSTSDVTGAAAVLFALALLATL